MGSIWFIATIWTIDGNGNATVSNEMESTTDSIRGDLSTPVRVPRLQWQFSRRDFVPDEMTFLHVAMGAIGAMNTVASQTGSIHDHWIGSFLPDYNAVNMFWLEQGQQVNETIIIATLVAEYKYMGRNGYYFKGLNTQVTLNGRTCTGDYYGGTSPGRQLIICGFVVRFSPCCLDCEGISSALAESRDGLRPASRMCICFCRSLCTRYFPFALANDESLVSHDLKLGNEPGSRSCLEAIVGSLHNVYLQTIKPAACCDIWPSTSPGKSFTGWQARRLEIHLYMT